MLPKSSCWKIPEVSNSNFSGITLEDSMEAAVNPFQGALNYLWKIPQSLNLWIPWKFLKYPALIGKVSFFYDLRWLFEHPLKIGFVTRSPMHSCQIIKNKRGLRGGSSLRPWIRFWSVLRRIIITLCLLQSYV